MINKSCKEFDFKKYPKDTVIGEFSGRDSVAAIMKAFESDNINNILPVASFAGSEYGDFNEIYNNYLETKKIVNQRYGNKKNLFDLIEYSEPKIWNLLNGRLMSVLTKKYDLFTPCIGCHLYFHLIKIPFAKKLSKKIISGERVSHDGRKKLNQLEKSLLTYQKIMKKLDMDLIMPVRDMKSGKEIEDLIGHNWKEGKNHPSCILSGNYRDTEGNVLYDEKKLNNFLEEFLIPAGEIIGNYLIKDNKKIKKLEKDILDII